MKGIDAGSIDPPSASFQEQAGHKIAQAAEGSQVRPFVWNGAERVDDGRFTYEFDSKGRLIRATEKANIPPLRRMLYTYSGTGRMVGRRAEYTYALSPAAGDWKLEDRQAVLDSDGLPRSRSRTVSRFIRYKVCGETTEISMPSNGILTISRSRKRKASPMRVSRSRWKVSRGGAY